MVIQICLQIWSSPHLTSKTFSELWEFYICSLPPQSQTGAEKKKQSQSRERKWTENFLGGPFQPLHNEVKSVLDVKESYSMGKKS